MNNKVGNITIEGAKLVFRNFSGEEGTYNAKGKRNFCVLIDDEDMAERLKSDGWNIKWLEPRDETEVRKAYLKVNVTFGNFPPTIVLITSKGKTTIDEESVNILDWAEIASADLIIRPYNYEGIMGRSGISAYLKALYVTVVVDELAEKYADVPDSAATSKRFEENE